MTTRSVQDQSVGVAEGVVAGGDDAVAGLEALLDLEVVRVLAAEADVAADGLVAVVGEDVGPVAAGRLVEAAAGEEESFLGAAQLQLDADRLSAPDLGGGGVVGKAEVDFEAAVFDLGVDAGDL